MAEIVTLNPLAAVPALNVKSDTLLGSMCSKKLEKWKPWDDEPLPTEVTRAALDALEHDLAVMLAPIKPTDLAAHIESLRAHYGEWGDLEINLAKRVNADWLVDFEGYPAGLFVEACRRWRNSAAKNPPTAGQLKAIVEGDLKRLKHVGWQTEKARRALARKPGVA